MGNPLRSIQDLIGQWNKIWQILYQSQFWLEVAFKCLNSGGVLEMSQFFEKDIDTIWMSAFFPKCKTECL